MIKILIIGKCLFELNEFEQSIKYLDKILVINSEHQDAIKLKCNFFHSK